MSRKHTPGPWRVSEARDRTLYIVQNYAPVARVAKVCGSTAIGEQGERMKATAAVLAAAPELLDALCELLATFEAGIDDREAFAPLIQKCDRAISKAVQS